jgi:type IV pilus assembly protein PilX
MIALRLSQRAHARGMVLVTALLMLVVVTILGLAMFRSFGLDEKIAGNLREKQRALSAAETAEQYAEYWLTGGGGSANAPLINCTAPAPASAPTICTNAITLPTQLPWTAGGNPVGVPYTPSAPTPSNPSVATPMNVQAIPQQGSYYAAPQFYVQWLGTTANGTVYQIDAQGFGSSPDTVAVVESTYIVQTSVKNLAPPTQ